MYDLNGTTHDLARYDTGPMRVGDFTTAFNPLQQAIVGYLARYKHPKVLNDNTTNLNVYFEWCLANELHPLRAVRGQIEVYLRWLEQQGWSEATIATRFGSACGFYKYAVIDDINPEGPHSRHRTARGRQGEAAPPLAPAAPLDGLPPSCQGSRPTPVPPSAPAR